MANQRQALISVSDKTGVLELAGALTKLGIRILSTGGTAFNDWLDNRLKAARTGLPGADATVDFAVIGGDGRTVRIEVRWTPPRETVRDAAGAKTAQSVTHRYRTVAAIVR